MPSKWIVTVRVMISHVAEIEVVAANEKAAERKALRGETAQSIMRLDKGFVGEPEVVAVNRSSRRGKG